MFLITILKRLFTISKIKIINKNIGNINTKVYIDNAIIGCDPNGIPLYLTGKMVIINK